MMNNESAYNKLFNDAKHELSQEIIGLIKRRNGMTKALGLSKDDATYICDEAIKDASKMWKEDEA